ncbi:MAG: transcriptional repressor LexA [Pseudomonadota bacterium]
MLTNKQKELLFFINERVSASGVPPSFDEMKEALDLRSKSGIHRLITALEERGFIRRLPHRARALEIVKLPEIAGEDDGRARAGGQVAGGVGAAEPNVSGETRTITSPPSAFASVPLMGRIAAGVPISAIQDHTQDVVCPPGMLGPGEFFALEVNGDSMVEAGIHDGDTVIIKRQTDAVDGEIVVALVDQEEATLKRLRRAQGKVLLEACNPAYETRECGPDQVEVQGRLVGLLRAY